MALDLPAKYESAVPPTTRRNVLIQGDERAQLVIDPGPRSIAGRDASGAKFDTACFFNLPVDLGELRTDGEGRLLVLGGYGVSQSVAGQPPQTFANRVEVTGLRPSPLPHHRTCGSASGGSYQTTETGRDLSP